MSERRVPEKLLGGRIRTSTATLLALFLSFLALYVVVRPPPETGPSSRAAQAERALEREQRAREKERGRAPAEPTPDAGGEATPEPTP